MDRPAWAVFVCAIALAGLPVGVGIYEEFFVGVGTKIQIVESGFLYPVAYGQQNALMFNNILL